ncbi:endoplasmic reticulum resident protein 27 [Centrocercus urophasianus]|uniref:endoplasmic reticulum resident protein 27 n=1 Tax=Centrocercus urophasianus TaxID=9002 RepID=UPI001C653258|nr:endoplasmic reticulum resident protein 27 [Centrocercus urophasianus]
MVKRRQAGTMGTSVFSCLFVILLAGSSPAGCAEDNSSTSHSTEGGTEKPVLLNDVADVEAFISGAEVAVVGFFQEPESPEVSQLRLAAARIPEVPFALSSSSAVREHYGVAAATVTLFRRADKERIDMDMDKEEIDADKMTRFIRMNELRLVTEYNPTTAVGVLHSSLQLHLLLFTDKKSPEHPEQMRRYREAAELFEDKILFVLVDINLKSNEQVMAYFKLKKSQLPALAIFHTPDEKHDVLPLDEVSIERVKDFCNAFLQKKQKVREHF